MKSLFKSAFVAGVAIGAMVSTTAVAQTVRMGTEGAYPHTTLSMIQATSMASSARSVTSCASGQI